MKPLVAALRSNNQQNQVKTPVPYASRYTTPGLGGMLTPSGTEAQMRAVGANGTLFAIVNKYASSVARNAWQLYRPLPPGAPEDTERQTVPSHASIDLWNTPTPQSLYTRTRLVKTFQQHKELVGEGIVVIVKYGSLPGELWPVRPDRMEPIPHPDKYLAGWVYHGPDGQLIPLETDVVIQMQQQPCPWDPYHGMGAVQTIMMDLYGAAAAAEWQQQFFKNSARPDGVIEVPESLSDTEFEQFQERWRATHQGASNAFRVAMLEHGASWKPTAYSPHDMQFVELQAAKAQNIREAFAFPKTMLGDIQDINRASAEAETYIYTSGHIVPRLDDIRDEMLNPRILPMYGATGRAVEWDYRSPVPEDAEAKDRGLTASTAGYKTLVDAGVHPDDAAQVVGLPQMRVVATPAPAPTREPVPTGAGARALPAAHTPNGHHRVTLAFGRQPQRPALPRAAKGDEEGDPDLGEVRADVDKALETLEREWRPVLAGQVDSLVTQVEEAIDAGDMAALAAISVPADLAGAAVLQEALDAMVTTAVGRAATEAAEQDAPLDEEVAQEDAAVAAGTVALAAAVAAVLAAALAATAVREALRLWSPGAPDPPTGRTVAAEVRVYLDGLEGADRRVVFGGSLHRVVNIGRLVVQSLAVAAVPGLRVAATEINDRNTCDPCGQVDGTVFRTVAAAWAAYGAGGYRDCEGGVRCRGTTRLVRA